MSETARSLHPYAWGLRQCKLDTDALQSGVLRLNELQLVFPDGEFFSAPAEDELPHAVNLGATPPEVTEVVFHAVIAPFRVNGSNCSLGEHAADAALHYSSHSLPATDLYTQAASADVLVLRRTVRLLADSEPRDHLVSVPVCRLRRNANGTFENDARFVPPAMSLHAAPALQAMLRRLLDILQAKVDALYGAHREPSKHVIEFRSGDVASFWLLHTASAACAALMHYRQHPLLHPERLYERMLELAGALMTFSKMHTLADLPAYQHAAPGPAFIRLDQLIRDLLETVISTRYFAIALREVKPSFHLGRLDSDAITPQTALYLGVGAALPASELVDVVPLRFKVGAPDDVEKLVLSAMGGVALMPTPQVPAAIPVRPGMTYFALEARGALYERMLQAKAMTLYAPAGISDLRLELFAVSA